jgi:hypothetical protein
VNGLVYISERGRRSRHKHTRVKALLKAAVLAKLCVAAVDAVDGRFTADPLM